MTRKERSLLLGMALFILVLFLLTLSGCGSVKDRTDRKAARKLRRAERLINEAQALGAVWSSDTLFTKMKFTVPGVKVEFIPKPLVMGKPMIFLKDSVRTEVLIVPGPPGEPDTVYVNTKIPAREVEKEVATAVNKSIEAGHGFWYHFSRIGPACLIVAFIVGFYVRGMIGNNINISLPGKDAST